jgi:C4-dicarboxylate transporter/malic acid transport protein
MDIKKRMSTDIISFEEKAMAQVATSVSSAPQEIAASVSLLRAFHPGWFGAVMGTAIVGVGAFMNPGNIAALQAPLRVIGIAFAILAYALLIALGIPYVLRWVHHPDAAWKDLQHPILGGLYGTFPGGILVLAVTTAAIGPALLPAGAVFALVGLLAAVGTLLAFAISVVFAYILFVTPGVNVENANGGWFIPPVVNIIIPMALLPLLSRADAETARLLLVISYTAWGIGFFLFLMVASLLYDRLVYHPLPAAPHAPSLWIGLGPIGVGSLALVRMAQSGAGLWGDLGPAVNALSSIGALALWGFGIWWLAAAILLLRRYLRTDGLPYGIGWWALTFPVGAYTVATLTLARLWKVSALELFGVLLFALLAVFWLVVTARTLVGMRTGEAWRR